MFNPITIILLLCAYIGGLFVIALLCERPAALSRKLGGNAAVYSLSLAIYCTSWTYYGSVGGAVNSGPLFLTIYLGPTLMIILSWTVLRKLVRIKETYRITSIADFIAARYGKSQPLAALATFIALVGVSPYIALQLKAIKTTFMIITQARGPVSMWIGDHVGPIVTALMIAFTIIIGVRRLDPTERHQGIVAAVAVESIVKLAGFMACGVFVSYFLFDGVFDVFRQFSETPLPRHMAVSHSELSAFFKWSSYLILAMSAVLFLPRQFHVAVVENSDESHIRTAMWLFPLYMFLINVFVFPIAMAGLLKGFPHGFADTFVLNLPLHDGSPLLILIVFIGGFSAATSMIMISSMTMSTMMINHLLLPVMDSAYLRRHLLKAKWIAVAAVIIMGYGFERQLGKSYTLINMGILSFAAALQFAPPILGGLFWKGGNKAGAVSGLAAGFLVWAYLLLLPSFIRSGWISSSLLENGPWGAAWLRPEALFGLSGLEPISHAVFWTLFFNIGLYIFGSLIYTPEDEDRRVANDFVDALDPRKAYASGGRGASRIDWPVKRRALMGVLNRYFDPGESAALLTDCLKNAGVAGKERISVVELADICSEAEKRLAGAIGAALARKALRQADIFEADEADELSTAYGDILAELDIGPEDLRRKIDYYRERDDLLTRHAEELERRVAERTAELAVAKERAEEASQAKSAFLASMSHELRTPLNAILGFAQILRRERNLTERQKEQLRTIETAGAHLLTLISDILDLSRIEAQKMELAIQIFHLPDLIREVFNISKIKADEKSVFVSYDEPAWLPKTVRGDERKLRQVLINLMDNAVKYTERGEVHLTVTRGEDGGRESRPDAGFAPFTLRLRVEDTGIGIPSDKLEEIFEPFAHGDVEGKMVEGTGLGLAISRKLIEMMGGALSVDSRLGEGSVFTLELPLETVEAEATDLRRREVQAVGYEGARKQVLIVDDNVTNLSMLAAFLDPLGFVVHTAVSGEDAIRKTREIRPDVILMDLLMPGMDGHEALVHIKALPLDVRIIGISAAVADGARTDEFARNCDAFIPKPVDTAELLKQLETLLGIAWIEKSRVGEAGEGPADEPETPVLLPDESVLDEISEKAELGDYTGVEAILARLTELNAEYAAFCRKIREYARRYDDEGMLRYIEGAVGEQNR